MPTTLTAEQIARLVAGQVVALPGPLGVTLQGPANAEATHRVILSGAELAQLVSGDPVRRRSTVLDGRSDSGVDFEVVLDDPHIEAGSVAALRKEVGTGCTGPTCDRRVLWGLTPDGKRVPLDTTPAVYRVLPPNSLIDAAQGVPIVRDRAAAVTHFATCPNAGDFTAGARRP